MTTRYQIIFLLVSIIYPLQNIQAAKLNRFSRFFKNTIEDSNDRQARNLRKCISEYTETAAEEVEAPKNRTVRHLKRGLSFPDLKTFPQSKQVFHEISSPVLSEIANNQNKSSSIKAFDDLANLIVFDPKDTRFSIWEKFRESSKEMTRAVKVINKDPVVQLIDHYIKDLVSGKLDLSIDDIRDERFFLYHLTFQIAKLKNKKKFSHNKNYLSLALNTLQRQFRKYFLKLKIHPKFANLKIAQYDTNDFSFRMTTNFFVIRILGPLMTNYKDSINQEMKLHLLDLAKKIMFSSMVDISNTPKNFNVEKIIQDLEKYNGEFLDLDDSLKQDASDNSQDFDLDDIDCNSVLNNLIPLEAELSAEEIKEVSFLNDYMINPNQGESINYYTHKNEHEIPPIFSFMRKNFTL